MHIWTEVSTEQSHCQGWTTWRRALRIQSAAGGYTVEYALYVLFSALFAGCAAVLVNDYAKYARHSGIPEIKTVLGGFVIRRFMGLWTLVVKSLGLCLAVASGLWLGKEGPLVHVACCCANLLMKLSPILNTNEGKYQLPCGWLRSLHIYEPAKERSCQQQQHQASPSLLVLRLAVFSSVSRYADFLVLKHHQA